MIDGFRNLEFDYSSWNLTNSPRDTVLPYRPRSALGAGAASFKNGPNVNFLYTDAFATI